MTGRLAPRTERRVAGSDRRYRTGEENRRLPHHDAGHTVHVPPQQPTTVPSERREGPSPPTRAPNRAPERRRDARVGRCRTASSCSAQVGVASVAATGLGAGVFRGRNLRPRAGGCVHADFGPLPRCWCPKVFNGRRLVTLAHDHVRPAAPDGSSSGSYAAIDVLVDRDQRGRLGNAADRGGQP